MIVFIIAIALIGLGMVLDFVFEQPRTGQALGWLACFLILCQDLVLFLK